MRIKRDKLEQLKAGGKAALISMREPATEATAAPQPPVESAPVTKKRWRFVVERDLDGFISSVTANEL